MANAILAHRLAGSPKEEFLSQYKDIANQDTGNINRQNLSYTDSPIFQKGYEAWNPTGLGSKVLQSWSLPVKNLVSDLTGKGMKVSGGAGIWGSPTAAGFENELIEPILSGTATTEQKQDFANVFGHEMGHLGWDYKPKGERINVPGVGKEGSKASGIMASDVALGGDYGGEEQWNYLHDLMYGGASARYGDVERKAAQEKNVQSFIGLPKGSPQREKAFEEALKNLTENPEKFTTSRVYDYLTNRGLINRGDLSYTPKAYNEIAWSGLTTPSKQAIGFGINPFEDTRAAGQWYKQQKYRKMSQAKKQSQMQQTIRQGEAAEAAKQKAQAQAQAQASQRQADQARISRAYKEETGGQAGSYAPGGGSGAHAADASGSTYSDPFDPGGGEAQGGFIDGTNRRRNYFNGGLIDFYRYGGFSG